MTEQAAPLWEASKENAAPLERGRNVRVLERSFQIAESTQEREEKLKMIQHYEKLVSSSDPSADDPLIHWLSYIKFHQEAFPSDTHTQFLLMERCTRALIQKSEYANDVRFIRVCVTYADRTSSPADVFKHLHQHKVGQKVALFWIAWAWVAESKGDYEFADKVFGKGIQKHAQPLDKLKQRHKQFQRRFAKHLLQQREEAEGRLEEHEENPSRRGALSGLTEDRVRHNDRASDLDYPSRSRRRPNPPSSSVRTFTDRSAMSATASFSSSNNDGGFAIFVDDSNHSYTADGYNLDQSYAHHDDETPRELEREVDRRKENSAAAERWNDRGGLPTFRDRVERVSATSAPAAASFDVYMDAECAAKLEREKINKKTEAERARRDRDERTLKMRTEVDVAEKLARDPMRYVRNPSKLAADQGCAEEERPLPLKEPPKTERNNVLSCGFNKRLVAKDANGQEQCFEEGRALAQFYRLVESSGKFNLLAVVTKQTDDSTMDMSVDEDGTKYGDRKPAARSHRGSSLKPPSGSRKLFDGDVTMESLTNSLQNLSTASSTINERDAVGVTNNKEEETINTKLAMKELSMMFSSPAVGLNDVSVLEEAEDGDGDTASFSLVGGLVDDNAANNSILAIEEEDDAENDEHLQPRNPNSRDTTAPDFHVSALRTLEGTIAGVTQQRQQQVGTGGGTGFQIYVDNDESSSGQSAPVAAAPFQIYVDGDSTSPLLTTAATTAFPIYGDQRRGTLSPSEVAAIFRRDSTSTRSSTAGKRDSLASGGDTATFSLFGDVMKGLDEVTANERPKSEAAAGFTIYVDDDDSTKDLESYGNPQAASSPVFGDISRIIADDVDITASVLRRDTASPRTRQSDEIGAKMSLDYKELHKNDIRLALRQVQNEVRQVSVSGLVRARDSNLARVLSTKGFVYDLPSESIPRVLVQKTSAKGANIVLGNWTGRVKEELGRGAYGKVVLLDSKDDADGGDIDIAVKAQSPTDCLAWEYLILKVVEERVGPHYSEATFPYPRASSFVSMANGGLLGMTNGSQNGLHLVDLSNVYRHVTQGTKWIPELIVIHYTIRMLKHIEALHWHGKIVHCDAKPDNWILSASDSAFEGCTGVIEGSELMLVDFGRAVDLQAAANSAIDPKRVRLEGSCAEKDMECVAMRKGLSWSFDADTFGICASAYVLLYGKHIDIKLNSDTKRWELCERLRDRRRHWNVNLWTEFFDTLLNLDEVTRIALGSRPESLRDLRKKMEAEVQSRGSSELQSLLKQQERMLPSNRL